MGCSSLTSINISDSLKYIDKDAFVGCNSLTSINIHESVKYIDTSAFNDCTQLTAINVSENNVEHQSIDGVLYSKASGELSEAWWDSSMLLRYPAAKSNDSTFIVPPVVSGICNDAFKDCKGLSTLIIPSSVKYIENAFSGCALKHLYLLHDSTRTVCVFEHLYRLPDYRSLSGLPTSTIIYSRKSEIDKLKELGFDNLEELKFYYPSDIQIGKKTISFSLARNEMPEDIDSLVSASSVSVKVGDTEITPRKNGRYKVEGLERDTPYVITVTCKITGVEDFSFTQTVKTKGKK